LNGTGTERERERERVAWFKEKFVLFGSRVACWDFGWEESKRRAVKKVPGALALERISISGNIHFCQKNIDDLRYRHLSQVHTSMQMPRWKEMCRTAPQTAAGAGGLGGCGAGVRPQGPWAALMSQVGERRWPMKAFQAFTAMVFRQSVGRDRSGISREEKIQ